jgi:hypothetical protein
MVVKKLLDAVLKRIFDHSSDARKVEAISREFAIIAPWSLIISNLGEQPDGIENESSNDQNSLPKNSSLDWRIFFFKGILQGLASRSLRNLEDGEFAIEIFNQIVQFGRLPSAVNLREILLRDGRMFIEQRVLQSARSMEESSDSGTILTLSNQWFSRRRDQVLKMLSKVQVSTRAIQIFCNHHKVDIGGGGRGRTLKGSTLGRVVPAMKKVLDLVVFQVKQLLAEQNCVAAFWVGNLKHRALDGAIVGSQIPILSKEASSLSDSPAESSDSDELTHEVESNAGDAPAADGKADCSLELESESFVEDESNDEDG